MQAVCVLRNQKTGKRHGEVVFTELASGKVRVQVRVSGIAPGLHGFHIHTTGDLREGCESLCAHYNPHNTNHGGRNSKERHVGDLGNIKANRNGVACSNFTDDQISLSGRHSIIGRSCIVHADRDDLGKGGNAESLKTGNAGKRILCGVVGHA